MARPRIFISSTYFDLKNIRADLERFIFEMGYEPILHERGHIPYGNQKALEAYCYKEIENCDILVSIVGSRFGSQSKEDDLASVSQVELKTALSLNRHCYIFVERDVLGEYRTYRLNKGNKIKYDSVDDERIFQFVEEVYALSKNNKVAPFESSKDIVAFLREQWAGLFQNLLAESLREEQATLMADMRSSIKTLGELVTYLTEQKDKGNEVIGEILLSNHPVFNYIRKLLNVKYRLYFTNLIELHDWLKARSYRPVDESEWDGPDYREWINKKEDPENWLLLKVSENLFDESGKLIVMTPDQWDDSLVSLTKFPQKVDDDIPF